MTTDNFQPIPGDGAKPRVKDIFKLAEAVAQIGSAGHQSVLSFLEDRGEEISSSFRLTITNYFSTAVDWGWLTRDGNTRATKYTATPRFIHHAAMAHISRPTHLRPIQSYSPEFLDSYEPNKTFYLSEAQRKLLHKACPVGSFDTASTNRDHKMRRFMADLSHHSAGFEGVEAKMADTIALLEKGIRSNELSVHDALVLRNHYNAIKYIMQHCSYPKREMGIRIDEYEVRTLHGIISDGLLEDRRQQGRLRTSSVGIARSAYVPPDIPDAIRAYFSKMIAKAAQIHDPYEQALFLVGHIPYLQAFPDCNKRLGRVVCNVPLLNSGIKPLSWASVNETDYVSSLVCLYERRSMYGLCDVFTHACLRSFERFDQVQQDAPDRVLEVLWAREIKAAVQGVVLYGRNIELIGVPLDQHGSCVALVESILADLADNEMIAANYGISRSAYQSWSARGRLDSGFGEPDNEPDDPVLR